MKIIHLFLPMVVLVFSCATLSASITVNPWAFSLYSFNDAGSSGSPLALQVTTPGGPNGVIGIGGNVYGIANAWGNGQSNAAFDVYVGGNATFSGNPNIGSSSAGGSINAVGNLTMTGSSRASGDVVIGGSLFGVSTANIQGNATLGGTNQGSVSIGGTLTQNQAYTAPVDFAAYNTYFTQASNYWGGLAQNVTLTGTTNLIGTLASGRNIINMTLAQWNSLTQLSLSGSSSTWLVINITDPTNSASASLDGTVLHPSGAGFQASNTLINYIASTSDLTITGGSTLNTNLLAPNANFDVALGTSNMTVQGGNLIAKSIIGNGTSTALNITSANDFVGFANDQSNFSVPVPEPSTYISLGSMLLGVFFLAGMKQPIKKRVA